MEFKLNLKRQEADEVLNKAHREDDYTFQQMHLTSKQPVEHYRGSSESWVYGPHYEQEHVRSHHQHIGDQHRYEHRDYGSVSFYPHLHDHDYNQHHYSHSARHNGECLQFQTDEIIHSDCWMSRKDVSHIVPSKSPSPLIVTTFVMKRMME